MKLKVAIGQTSPITGDLAGNTGQILNYINKAKEENIDILVFPETCITGYCCGALFDQIHFLSYAEEFLNYKIIPEVTDDLVVVIGSIDFLGVLDGKPRLGNAAFVIQNQSIINVYHKTLLANDDHHEDRKYFIKGLPEKIVCEVNIRGEKIRIATPICEDIWHPNTKQYQESNCLVEKSVKQYGADIICVPNYSYFYYGKQVKREKLLSNHAFNNQVPIIYTNCAAVGDIVKNVMVYDGGSVAYDNSGQKIAQAKFFDSDFVEFSVTIKEPIFNLETSVKERISYLKDFSYNWWPETEHVDWFVNSFLKYFDRRLPTPFMFMTDDGSIRLEWFDYFSPSININLKNKSAELFSDYIEESYFQLNTRLDWNYMNDLLFKHIYHFEKNEEIFNALKFAQKEFFKVCGLKKAQVHLSGGIDSAVVAVIAVEAMGKENVIFITNPTDSNSIETQDVAVHIANKLNVPLLFNPTRELFNIIINGVQKDFLKDPSPLAQACAQAVGRTVQGLVASHVFGTGIIACGNHTEIVEGWANFHDIGSIGVHSLIGDLTKVEVFQMAQFINEKYKDEVIPSKLYNGEMKPQAELADFKFDPFDYFIRSGIDAEMIRNRKGINDLLEDFQNKKLTPDFFPIDWDGKKIYEKINLEQFKEQVFSAFNNSRKSVYKAAQSAPQVIISPTSRGFSNRETIINHYKGYYEL